MTPFRELLPVQPLGWPTIRIKGEDTLPIWKTPTQEDFDYMNQYLSGKYNTEPLSQIWCLYEEKTAILYRKRWGLEYCSVGWYKENLPEEPILDPIKARFAKPDDLIHIPNFVARVVDGLANDDVAHVFVNPLWVRLDRTLFDNLLLELVSPTPNLPKDVIAWLDEDDSNREKVLKAYFYGYVVESNDPTYYLQDSITGKYVQVYDSGDSIKYDWITFEGEEPAKFSEEVADQWISDYSNLTKIEINEAEINL